MWNHEFLKITEIFRVKREARVWLWCFSLPSLLSYIHPLTKLHPFIKPLYLVIIPLFWLSNMNRGYDRLPAGCRKNTFMLSTTQTWTSVGEKLHSLLSYTKSWEGLNMKVLDFNNGKITENLISCRGQIEEMFGVWLFMWESFVFSNTQTNTQRCCIHVDLLHVSVYSFKIPSDEN